MSSPRTSCDACRCISHACPYLRCEHSNVTPVPVQAWNCRSALVIIEALFMSVSMAIQIVFIHTTNSEIQARGHQQRQHFWEACLLFICNDTCTPLVWSLDIWCTYYDHIMYIVLSKKHIQLGELSTIFVDFNQAARVIYSSLSGWLIHSENTLTAGTYGGIHVTFPRFRDAFSRNLCHFIFWFHTTGW